ncbi:unnamed protein product [Natator depressus]
MVYVTETVVPLFSEDCTFRSLRTLPIGSHLSLRAVAACYKGPCCPFSELPLLSVTQTPTAIQPELTGRFLSELKGQASLLQPEFLSPATFSDSGMSVLYFSSCTRRALCLPGNSESCMVSGRESALW